MVHYPRKLDWLLLPFIAPATILLFVFLFFRLTFKISLLPVTCLVCFPHAWRKYICRHIFPPISQSLAAWKIDWFLCILKSVENLSRKSMKVETLILAFTEYSLPGYSPSSLYITSFSSISYTIMPLPVLVAFACVFMGTKMYTDLYYWPGTRKFWCSILFLCWKIPKSYCIFYR